MTHYPKAEAAIKADPFLASLLELHGDFAEAMMCLEEGPPGVPAFADDEEAVAEIKRIIVHTHLRELAAAPASRADRRIWAFAKALADRFAPNGA